jgi:hypothetical protein
MYPHQAAPPPQPPHSRGPRNTLIVIGALIACILLCAGLGALVSRSDAADEPAPSTTQVAPTTTTAEAAAPTTATAEPPQNTEAPAPPSAPDTTQPSIPARPAGTYSDPRCAPASETLVAVVASGLTKDGLTLTNGTVIDNGDSTFIGATTMRADGRMESRSDVWTLHNGVLYASTGGARRLTTFPKAPSGLGIGPGDELVAAADECVADVSR